VADYSDRFADEHWSRTRSAVAHINRVWHSINRWPSPAPAPR